MACTNRQFSGRLPANDPLRRGLSFNLLESYHSNLELSIRKCVQQRKMFPSGARAETLVRRACGMPTPTSFDERRFGPAEQGIDYDVIPRERSDRGNLLVLRINLQHSTRRLPRAYALAMTWKGKPVLLLGVGSHPSGRAGVMPLQCCAIWGSLTN